MNRHAYLIMAHTQWDLLDKLIKLLDYEWNDIFIHIDKKANIAPTEELRKHVLYSRIIIVERISVFRGSYSLFDAEMKLLKTACDFGDYSYYHLLSGQDLPLRDQNYIYEFFEKNFGRNFIDIVAPGQLRKEWYERASLFQFFLQASLVNSMLTIPAKCVRKITLFLQRMARINRFEKYEKQGFSLCFGSNWFSITRPFAEYLIENERLIRQMFEKHTFAPEELIPQTFLWSSEFRDTLYDSEELDHDLHRANMRLVFWNGKTSPETITMKHMDQIRTSTNLFARKFDYENHPDAVEAVIEMVKSGGR